MKTPTAAAKKPVEGGLIPKSPKSPSLAENGGGRGGRGGDRGGFRGRRSDGQGRRGDGRGRRGQRGGKPVNSEDFNKNAVFMMFENNITGAAAKDLLEKFDDADEVSFGRGFTIHYADEAAATECIKSVVSNEFAGVKPDWAKNSFEQPTSKRGLEGAEGGPTKKQKVEDDDDEEDEDDEGEEEEEEEDEDDDDDDDDDDEEEEAAAAAPAAADDEDDDDDDDEEDEDDE